MRTDRKRRTLMVYAGSASVLVVGAVLLQAQVFPKEVTLDRSRPVPTRQDLIDAWTARQEKIKTFRFSWTEEQVHPRGWISNPRFPQREFSLIPGLNNDRNFTVRKALAVDGKKMRYSFELERPEEADGVRVTSDSGDNKGLGLGRHFSYLSTFDGVTGRLSMTTVKRPDEATGARRTSEAEFPEPLDAKVSGNLDAQTLDTRAFLMTFRPLDSVMGHPRLSRAVTNRGRTMYKGKSTFLLEESHDPTGWKMILRIEPERDFTVCQFLVVFEQKLIAAIEMDYTKDPKWGWIPSGWQLSQMLDDGSTRVLSTAKVTKYSINEPIAASEFR